MPTVSEKISQSIQLMPDPDCARTDAEILIARALKKSRTWLKAYANLELTFEQINDIEQLIERRRLGNPVAYILGEWEFYSLPLKVSPATLIPRPETEQLVDRAVQILELKQKPNVLDLGTGTGAIALAIKKECANARVSAVEFSDEALKVAKENAKDLNLEVSFLHGSWFEPVSKKVTFDVIVSNPPYVANDDPHLLQGDLPFEPIAALTAGDDEFADIKTIIAGAISHLNDHGYLLIEHGYNQGAQVKAFFEQAGLINVQVHKDYAGNERFTEGMKLIKNL